MADVLVVKLGSSSVTKAAGPDQELLSSALSDAIEAQRLGWHVVIVSSGAESSGFAHLSATLGHRSSARLAAAVGQPLLMNMYSAPIGGRTHVLAQVLISQADLRSAAQMRVVADVLAECFRAGIVPIVNGNDVTDPDGSDNDSVATGIAVSVGADKLLLLTDVQGVYQGVPGRSPRYETLDVAEIGQVRLAASGTGRGGMRSKLRAAELASHNGIETVIAHARSAHAILSCVKGQAIGTRVLPVSKARPPDKRWIAGIARSHGRLVINREAESSGCTATSPQAMSSTSPRPMASSSPGVAPTFPRRCFHWSALCRARKSARSWPRSCVSSPIPDRWRRNSTPATTPRCGLRSGRHWKASATLRTRSSGGWRSNCSGCSRRPR
jgi:glutamate 5-kinase